MTLQVGSQDEVPHPSWSEQLIKWKDCQKHEHYIFNDISPFTVGTDPNVRTKIKDRKCMYKK